MLKKFRFRSLVPAAVASLIPAAAAEPTLNLLSKCSDGCGFNIDGKLSSATIRSVVGTKCKVRYGDKIIDLDLPAGTAKKLES